MMRIGDITGSLGRGLAAGAVGTAAVTATMTLEQKLRGEPENTVAGDAAEEVLGVEAPDEKSKLRLARSVHWLYGTAWGGLRGLLPALGLSPRSATTAHFTAVTGTAMVMPPALGVMPPPQKQPPVALGTATVHHVVYALATAAAFTALDKRRAA